MSIDAERLRAAGHPITLLGGEVVPLRYDFAACLTLEAKYGTLMKMSAALRFIASPFDTVLHFVAAGIGRPAAEVLPLLEVTRIGEYQEAIARAIDEAFPAPDAEGNAPGETTVSNGHSSTSSPPSDTDAAMATSGG